ncbi:hypothetical protein D3C76_1727600 [compost metagenome]
MRRPSSRPMSRLRATALAQTCISWLVVMRVSARLRSAALMPLPASNASLDSPWFLKVLSTRETALRVVRWE